MFMTLICAATIPTISTMVFCNTAPTSDHLSTFKCLILSIGPLGVPDATLCDFLDLRFAVGGPLGAIRSISSRVKAAKAFLLEVLLVLTALAGFGAPSWLES